jgi:hypothetical protein
LVFFPTGPTVVAEIDTDAALDRHRLASLGPLCTPPPDLSVHDVSLFVAE